ALITASAGRDAGAPGSGEADWEIGAPGDDNERQRCVPMAVDEIYILHHTHVDVGYTDPQWIIYDRHVEFIEQALDYCAQTDDYPDDARFRWISEFSWPVVRFIRERPDRADELMERLREGRFELCGLYLDPTELMDRRAFEHSLRPARELAAEHDFPLTTVMTTDIPGQGWSLANVIIEQGLSWLSVSPNSMVSKPLEVERPFYWVGPRGNRVLVWQTDWRKGWYGEGHVLGFPEGFEVARERVTDYLDLLASEGYKWRALALHMAADNRPPWLELCDLVRAWNDAGGLPRMRIATNREFFERLVELHGDEFAEYRAAWPDWWSEGLGSAAYETALARETHCRLARVEALQKRAGDDRDLWDIVEDLLMFDEHTWGCSAMALNPHSFMSRATWAHKSSYIYRACDRARRLEAELAAQAAEQARDPVEDDYRDATLHTAGPTAQIVSLFNPMDEDYYGPLALPALAPEVTGLRLADGSEPAVQRSVATPLAEEQTWTIAQVAAGEAATLTPIEGAPETTDHLSADEAAIENEHYRIEFDDTGRVTSIMDLSAGEDLLDADAPWRFAETIHEHISGDRDRMAVWERHTEAIPWGNRRTDAPFAREGSLASSELLAVQSGPVFAGVIRRSSLPDVRYMETELRLWRGLKRIDVEVRLDKQPRESYESLYVAFPFALEQPRAFLHSCGATFEAEREQLPGSCRDYYAVEHFAAMAGADGWAVVCPVDAPLVQLGGLTFGRWADHLELDHAHIYSWLTNNFWYTNFPGYQLGHLRFRFVITTGGGEFDSHAAEAFGRAVRVGLTAV
ncbi:MAG: hypothetical protein J7M38_11180, partial [Armatimonadetes bacterium]|nr:hypothetical protein [Armatimonadota bacterium]